MFVREEEERKGKRRIARDTIGKGSASSRSSRVPAAAASFLLFSTALHVLFKTIISSRTLFCTRAIIIHLTTQFSTYAFCLDSAPQDSGPILQLPLKKCRARDDGNLETRSLSYERQQHGQCSEEPGGSRAGTCRTRALSDLNDFVTNF